MLCTLLYEKNGLDMFFVGILFECGNNAKLTEIEIHEYTCVFDNLQDI